MALGDNETEIEDKFIAIYGIIMTRTLMMRLIMIHLMHYGQGPRPSKNCLRMVFIMRFLHLMVQILDDWMCNDTKFWHRAATIDIVTTSKRIDVTIKSPELF